MTLRVGTWPGAGSSLNTFIDIFCSSLASAGLEIVDIADPLAIDPAAPGIDVLQIHWAEMIFQDRGRIAGIVAAARLVRQVRRLRARGVRVVWLVHNLRPHGLKAHRKPVWAWFSRRLARNIDGVLTLSPATLPIVLATFPFRPGLLAQALRHPAYSCAQHLPHAPQRARFGIPTAATAFVYAGIIRPYKGVDDLIRCLGAMDPARHHLSVAGLVRSEGYEQRLAQQCKSLPHVQFRPGKLDEEPFEALLASADYVVLPFIDTLHSGSIVHALSLGRPVVTPSTPYARDLRDKIGADWLHLYEGPLTPAFLDNLPPPPAVTPDLSCLSPQRFGEEVAAFYKDKV